MSIKKHREALSKFLSSSLPLDSKKHLKQMIDNWYKLEKTYYISSVVFDEHEPNKIVKVEIGEQWVHRWTSRRERFLNDI